MNPKKQKQKQTVNLLHVDLLPQVLFIFPQHYFIPTHIYLAVFIHLHIPVNSTDIYLCNLPNKSISACSCAFKVNC